jgi:ribosomal protein S18 acetylase RimI-like enzyme
VGEPSVEVIRWGRERARTGPWRGDRRIAYLAPVADAPPPSEAFIRRCIEGLARQGYERVVTGALSANEQRGFLSAGFIVEEELHLLAHDLRSLPPPPPAVDLHRAGAAQRAAVLEVDHLAFAPFWRLDRSGLQEALSATPHTRFRVVTDDDEPAAVLGYAICGRAGIRGFVQRLAVCPKHHRRGFGRALLLDGLAWMRRRRVERAVVNTQQGNEAALALYNSVGFRQEPVGLKVLARTLT